MGGTVRFANIVLGFAALGVLLSTVIVRDLSRLASDPRIACSAGVFLAVAREAETDFRMILMTI